MTGYIIILVIGIVIQLSAIVGIMVSNKVVEVKEYETVTQSVVDRETGEVIHETYRPLNHQKWKIVRRQI